MKHYAFRRCPFMPLLIHGCTPKKKFLQNSIVTIAGTVLAVILFGSMHTPLFAQSPILGDAPLADETTPQHNNEKVIQSAALQDASSVLAVDPSTRQGSLDFYNANYVNRSTTAMNWTGDQGSCNAGNLSGTFEAEYIHRINYFRAMAGSPGNVTLSAAYNQKAQNAALMMSANNRLSHGPDSGWKCYSEAGKEAAGSSNLFLGRAGVDSVDGYIMDPGASNTHVGHRRWLLHPATERMGIGSVANKDGFREANAIWVFDDTIWNPRPATRDGFVAWPPPGFVPHTVVFSRWSFALPDADFSSASVSMISNGQAGPVSVEPIANGFGENTLVWKAMGLADGAEWPTPDEDTAYTVTIRNVLINGQAQEFTYTTTVFDPDAAVPSIDVNFDAAAPGSFLTVRGDGFTANQRVPIKLNDTVVQNATANARGELNIILDTRGSDEGAYLISAPVLGNTKSGYQLDEALPVRPKENIPGVTVASVRDVAPLNLLFVPLISQ